MEESMKITGLVTISVKRANGTEELICKDNPNLLTTAGRDWIHGQVYNAGTTDEAKYIALSTDSNGSSTAHTSVAGEIVTNGLERAAGTVTHVAGTNSTTISNIFTSNGSFTGVQLVGLLTASSSGTLVHENTFTPVNLEQYDQLTISWQLTLS